jgi:acetyl esterase/lipase
LSAPFLDSRDRPERFISEGPRQGILTRYLADPPWDVFEGRSREYLPRAYLRPGMPPARLFGEAEDPLWPAAEEFCEAIPRAGNDCVARPFAAAGHAYSLEGQADHATVTLEIRRVVAGWVEDV